MDSLIYLVKKLLLLKLILVLEVTQQMELIIPKSYGLQYKYQYKFVFFSPVDHGILGVLFSHDFRSHHITCHSHECHFIVLTAVIISPWDDMDDFSEYLCLG